MGIPNFESFEGFRTIYSDSELRNAIAIASAIREIVGGGGGGGDASAANQTLQTTELVNLNTAIATSLDRTLSQVEATINDSLLYLQLTSATHTFTLNSSTPTFTFSIEKAVGFTLFYNTTTLTDSSVNLFIEGSNATIYNTLLDNAQSLLITSTGTGSIQDENTNINFLRIRLVGDAVIAGELKIRSYGS